MILPHITVALKSKSTGQKNLFLTYSPFSERNISKAMHFNFCVKYLKFFFREIYLFDFTNLCFLQEDKEVNMKEDILAVAKFDKQFNDTYRAYLDQQDDSYVMADEEIITVKESLVWKYV